MIVNEILLSSCKDHRYHKDNVTSKKKISLFIPIFFSINNNAWMLDQYLII